MNRALLASVFVLASCGADSTPLPPVAADASFDAADDIDAQTIECSVSCAQLDLECGVVQPESCAAPIDCGGCDDGFACDADGRCATASADSSDYEARVTLTVRSDYFSAGLCKPAEIGRAAVSLWTVEPRPADNRETFATAGDELCTWARFAANHPDEIRDLGSGGGGFDGVRWPQPSQIGGGNFNINVAGAPGPIQWVAWMSDTFGYKYRHEETPPRFREGASVCPGLFDPSYIPFDAPFTVAMDSGVHIQSLDLHGGRTPETLEVLEPAIESDVAPEVLIDQPLTVRWTPATSQTSRIQLRVAHDGVGQLNCFLEDDGEATIPVEAMAKFGVFPFWIEVLRSEKRFETRTVEDGMQLFVEIQAFAHVIGDVVGASSPSE